MEASNIPATSPGNSLGYSINNTQSLLHLAKELTKFIKEQGLSTPIQGKAYPMVEAWTFAGMSMGLVPIPTELINESDGQEIKYRAIVEIKNISTGEIVGRGFAICSNKEQKKKYFDEYAIASMAQTRATGKAFRIPLGWLIKAAGFEATPYEEMEAVIMDAPAKDEYQRRTPKTKEELTESVSTEGKVNESGAMATTRQKAEILLLLNNNVITPDEKEVMIGNINKLDRERADKSIEKLKKTIDQRQGGAVA